MTSKRVPRDGANALEIDASRVRHVADSAQAFFDSLARRATLAAREVVQAGADLQHEAHERDLVADGFEEQLLEEIAGLEPVAGVEETQRRVKTRIVLERRKHAAEL